MRESRLQEVFGLILRSMREEAGLTQEELADGADLTSRYISQLERGRQSPTLAALEALAAPLRRHPHELIEAAEKALRQAERKRH